MAKSGAVQFVGSTGATYNTWPGIVQAGGSWGDDGARQKREGIYGVGVGVGGPALAVCRFGLLPVNGAGFHDKILRATYAALPSPADFEVGDDVVSRKGAAWYCNSATISCEAGGALMIDYEWHYQGEPTADTGAVAQTAAKTTFEWYRGYMTLGGAAAECRSISFTVNNNLIPRYDLNTKASSKRYPTVLVAGAEVVEASAVYHADPAHDATLDELPIATLVLVAVNAAGTPQTFTITGTGMQVASWESGFASSNDLVEYSANYALDDNDITGFTIGFA